MILRLLFTAALFLAVSIPGSVLAQQSGHDIVLLLDNSGSMKKNDPQFLAKQAVEQFVTGFSPDDRIAVIIFDEKVRIPVPLSPVDDSFGEMFDESLATINYRGQFTNSPDAMERALYILKKSGRDDASKSVVFLTDGIIDTGNAQRDRDSRNWMREDLGSDANKNNIQFYGIAFTEFADFQLIQSLASRTDGDYYRAATAADLQGVFDDITSRLTYIATPEPPAVPEPEYEPEAATKTAIAPEAAPEAEIATEPKADPVPEPVAVPVEAATEPVEPMVVAPTPSPVTATPVATDIQSTLATPPSNDRAQPTDKPVKTEQAAPLLESPGFLYSTAGGIALLVLIIIWLLLRGKRNADTGPDAASPQTPPGQPTTTQAAAAPVAEVHTQAPDMDDDMTIVPSQSTTNVTPAPLATAIPDAYLVDLGNITGDATVPLNQTLTRIGRIAQDDRPGVGQLILDQPTVGRNHATIEYRQSRFWLVDQNSRNGTFVNGNRISADTPLETNDLITFHEAEFRFVVTAEDSGDETLVAADDTMVADSDETLVASPSPQAPDQPNPKLAAQSAAKLENTAAPEVPSFDSQAALPDWNEWADEGPSPSSTAPGILEPENSTLDDDAATTINPIPIANTNADTDEIKPKIHQDKEPDWPEPDDTDAVNMTEWPDAPLDAPTDRSPTDLDLEADSLQPKTNSKTTTTDWKSPPLSNGEERPPVKVSSGPSAELLRSQSPLENTSSISAKSEDTSSRKVKENEAEKFELDSLIESGDDEPTDVEPADQEHIPEPDLEPVPPMELPEENLTAVNKPVSTVDRFASLHLGSHRKADNESESPDPTLSEMDWQHLSTEEEDSDATLIQTGSEIAPDSVNDKKTEAIPPTENHTHSAESNLPTDQQESSEVQWDPFAIEDNDTDSDPTLTQSAEPPPQTGVGDDDSTCIRSVGESTATDSNNSMREDLAGSDNTEMLMPEEEKNTADEVLWPELPNDATAEDEDEDRTMVQPDRSSS